MSFLSSPAARILTLLLLLQAAAYYGLARTEEQRVVQPLATFPKEFQDWVVFQEGTVEKEVMDVLQADDAMTRWYGNAKEKQVASLFIAYFATQRTGKVPHSPKHCLPGAGWSEVMNDRIQIPISDSGQSIPVNRYLVQRGDDRSLVIYFYQTKHRAVASEYRAKIFTVLDSIRYNRSDTALVRVTMPIRPEMDMYQSTAGATSFIQQFYGKLMSYFPN